MGPRVTLTAHAYACATLHAVAHPTCSVNGVLLGPPLAAADTAQGGDAGGPVTHVTAAVPLFHSNLGLAPMYDVALALVEAHAQASGQRVVGYYHANALAKDTELPTQARRVADALAAAHPGCIVLLADAQALADRETALPPVAWQLFVRDGAKGTWCRPEESNGAVAVPPEALQKVAALSGVGADAKLSDVEDHLDDVTRDFSNAELLP